MLIKLGAIQLSTADINHTDASACCKTYPTYAEGKVVSNMQYFLVLRKLVANGCALQTIPAFLN